MGLESEISLNAAKAYGEKYDAAAKQVFMHPEIIAPVLRAVVPEYRNYSTEQIIGFIIKDSINDDPVDDVSRMANQLPSEMSSVSDKLITYDSRFKAVNPRLSDESITFYLHIDLEVQNDYRPSNPSYPVIKRAVYYGARELSSQLGVITEETNYDKLEKVYSIWICNENIPQNLVNTVTSYKLVKSDEIGTSDEPDKDYDLLNVIIIRRGDESGDAEVFDYLNGVFTSDIDRICKYVDIRENETIVKGVQGMSGLGETIYNKGAIEMLIQLVKEGLIQVKDASKKANMTEEEFEELCKKYNCK